MYNTYYWVAESPVLVWMLNFKKIILGERALSETNLYSNSWQ